MTSIRLPLIPQEEANHYYLYHKRGNRDENRDCSPTEVTRTNNIGTYDTNEQLRIAEKEVAGTGEHINNRPNSVNGKGNCRGRVGDKPER